MSTTADPSRPRLAVLFGGRSTEHAISCVSAGSVLEALADGPWELVPVGITRSGSWVLAEPDQSYAIDGETLPEVRGGRPVVLSGDEGFRGLRPVDGGELVGIDVVFPVLHGPFGEDGAIQGLFELADVPYVGAGVLGSAIGMDKDVQKRLFLQAGLPVGPFETVHEKGWEDDPESVEASAEALGYPVFTKPATLGSSVGVSKVHEAAQLAAGLAEAFRYARVAVVERAADGAREIECAVLGNDEPVASVAGEIVPEGHDFYDYEAKYLDEHGARLLIPAELEPEVLAEVQRLAVAAFRTTRCSGMARVDFFLMGEDELWVNELNTIPGFTSISMYPKLWEASGLAYRDLVQRLLDLAIERHDAERKSTGVPDLGG
jgi:D-alanine-D-alanine ligase